MLVLAIFALVCIFGIGIGAGFLINATVNKKSDVANSKKRIRNYTIVFLLSLSLLLASTLTINSNMYIYTKNALCVARICSIDGQVTRPLYYNAQTDEYFVVYHHMFNIFNLSDKVVVAKDVAMDYVAAYNALNSIDILTE